MQDSIWQEVGRERLDTLSNLVIFPFIICIVEFVLSEES